MVKMSSCEPASLFVVSVWFLAPSRPSPHPTLTPASMLDFIPSITLPRPHRGYPLSCNCCASFILVSESTTPGLHPSIWLFRICHA